MDLLKKIDQLRISVDKLKQLTEDLGETNLSRQKKIENLKEEIEKNVTKIDKIIENYNANN
tara:strand:- start:332 stop:514 length:183 start_codon:yes stop_codon:yes gene_type:complete